MGRSKRASVLAISVMQPTRRRNAIRTLSMASSPAPGSAVATESAQEFVRKRYGEIRIAYRADADECPLKTRHDMTRSREGVRKVGDLVLGSCSRRLRFSCGCANNHDWCGGVNICNGGVGGVIDSRRACVGDR